MKNNTAVDFLIKIVHTKKEQSVVRHEAAEALSNFHEFKDRIINELKIYWNSDISVLRSTVRIAIRKLENFKKNDNNYCQFNNNIEPAEPFSEIQLKKFLKEIGKSKKDLLELVLSKEIEEYQKYRIIYYLRNQGTELSMKILSELLKFKNREKTSALMRHEISFVFGLLNNKADYDFVKKSLEEVIRDQTESSIVRHEAIISYNGIFGFDKLLQDMLKDPNPLIYESTLICDNN